MPQKFYVKTAPSSWAEIRNLFVKTSSSSWAAVVDAWVKVSSSSWAQFWSAPMSPTSTVQLIESYTGTDSATLRLQGRNYKWVPTPQTLKYYFRWIPEGGSTYYIGSSGSSGDTTTNPATSTVLPGTSSYITISPSGSNYELGKINRYYFEVRATGASGTVYSSISQEDVKIVSPKAPTLTYTSTSSTSITLTITAASFNDYLYTNRYILYTYDNIGGYIYSGGGRGGLAVSQVTTTTLTGLVSGRTYLVYVLPVTGSTGTTPSNYSGYPGVEAYLSAQTQTQVTPTITSLTASAPSTASQQLVTVTVNWASTNQASYFLNVFQAGVANYQDTGTTATSSNTSDSGQLFNVYSGASVTIDLTVYSELGQTGGSSTQSITYTPPIVLSKLSTPTGVNATDTRTDGVNVTWNAVTGAAYYGVWYGGAPGYDALADFGGNRNTSLITGTSYLDTAIGSGVQRDYYVQAYRSGDPTGTKSEWGGPDSGTRANVVVNLTAPSIFNVVKSGSNYLVYFSGGSGPAYQVWWQTVSGTPTTTSYDASGSSSPITVTNLTASAGSTYYFSARSVSSAGNTGSGPSGTISSWSGQYAYTEPSAAPATAPGTPGTPTNGWTSGTSYPFSWSAPSTGTVSGGGAATITGYTMRIYEATSSSGTGSYILTTIPLGSGTSYTYTSPNASLYYAASVAATNSANLTGSYSGISQYK